MKPLHLRSMLSKLMQSTENCNAYNRNWSTERILILLHGNAQPHTARPTLQKLNELGYKVFPHPPYSPDLLPTDYHLFKHHNNFFFISSQRVFLFIFFSFFFIVVDFVIHLNETAMGLHVFPFLIPPPPPPSPPDPSRSSQCTRSERLSHASNLGW